MACQNINVHNENIFDLLRAIDKMQKEAVINMRNNNCDNCLLPVMHNTKPIRIYNACCQFEVKLPGNEEKFVDVFRVEKIMGNNTVLLRLLACVNKEYICTPYTVVINTECICCIQCLEPINCTLECAFLQ